MVRHPCVLFKVTKKFQERSEEMFFVPEYTGLLFANAEQDIHCYMKGMCACLIFTVTVEAIKITTLLNTDNYTLLHNLLKQIILTSTLFQVTIICGY